MKTTVGIIESNGKPLTLQGELSKEGAIAPSAKLTDKSLQTVNIADFKGKNILISVMPSVDTPVCAVQTKRFNKEVAQNDDLILITVSMDLPFALNRFCADENIENALTLSDYKYREFGLNYGFYIEELGLLARGIVVIDETGKIVYVEYVKEISNEPDYDKALSIIDQL